MARLHVIYDPTETLQCRPEIENRLKLKMASLSIPDDMTYEDAKDIVTELVELLVKQL